MKVYVNPPRSEWADICRRPLRDDPVVRSRVETILSRVKSGGDEALRALSAEIEGRSLAVAAGQDGLPLEVPSAVLEGAAGRVAPPVRDAIARAAAHIRAFHEAQRPREVSVLTAPGVRCIQRPVPIGRVGLYIPGGTAPLFSTVLMLAIPAAIARCPEVILCTPAGPSGEIAPEVLYAASYCGIRRVFCLGGAQAIAAMAYGTETIPRVDKIFGPGNRYVTTAKQLLSASTVAIDMPAGPSEVMVIADDSSSPAFVAADLLSQAEHGADSQVMLVCRSEAFAARVLEEVDAQLKALPRGSIASQALEHSRAVVMESEDDTVAFADCYAPEHLILSLRDSWKIADRITAAGSVFVGPWTCESAGDYASGTNHTLPTCGWARSFSGVNLDSFYRKMTLQELSREGLEALAPTITAMADAEGLAAHAQAVRLRLATASPVSAKGSVCAAESGPSGDRAYPHVSANESEGPLSDLAVRSLMRANIRSLAPYSTARDEYTGQLGIFLDANENPYPTGWNRYPDPRQRQLKERVAAIKGVGTEHIFLGNGSDEAIDLMYRIFCEPGLDNALVISPSYGMYTVAAGMNGVEVRPIPLGENYSLPAAAIAAATDSRSKLLFLCSPNNPTGNAYDLEELAAVVRAFPGITVVDEAYADFSAKGSLLPRLDEFPRLVILQTFSKAWGLAGLRLGMAFAGSAIIRTMDQVKYPYNINQPAQEKALAALQKDVKSTVRELVAQREALAAALPELPFVRKVWPSDANFLLVKMDDPRAVYDHLLRDGIIVRDRSRIRLCEGCLRITVGTPEENARLLASLDAFSKH